jgi:hypothetical protein
MPVISARLGMEIKDYHRDPLKNAAFPVPQLRLRLPTRVVTMHNRRPAAPLVSGLVDSRKQPYPVPRCSGGSDESFEPAERGLEGCRLVDRHRENRVES